MRTLPGSRRASSGSVPGGGSNVALPDSFSVSPGACRARPVPDLPGYAGSATGLAGGDVGSKCKTMS
jgi:hypothetical protein